MEKVWEHMQKYGNMCMYMYMYIYNKEKGMETGHRMMMVINK